MTDIRMYYELLGIPSDATEDEIRVAYRQKVKEWHPDYGGDDESFVRLREAYAYALDHARSRRTDDEEQPPLIRKIGALIIVLIMFFSVIYFSLLIW
jgi:curved DNA-binding protein CbpA